MKHEIEWLNTSLEEAQVIRGALRKLGVPVADIICNPNNQSTGHASKVPEDNIETTGEWNLEFRFDGVQSTSVLNVAVVRDMVKDGGRVTMAGLMRLHRSIYPHASPAELWGRLGVNREIETLVEGYAADLWRREVDKAPPEGTPDKESDGDLVLGKDGVISGSRRKKAKGTTKKGAAKTRKRR